MMTEEQLILAAAYVDDELSPFERAQAENDPVVWAEVQRQRSVQQLAAAIPPYSHDVAQRQIATAIAAAGPHETGLAPVSVLADHRRRNRWLGGSIAAGLLIAVGGVGFLALRNGAEDGSSTAADASEETYAADAPAVLNDERAPSTAPAAAADQAESDSTMADAAAGDDDGTAGSAGPSPIGGPGPLTFADEEELIEVARIAIARAALTLQEPPASDCKVTADSGASLPVLADAVSSVDDYRDVVIAIEPLDDLRFVVYVADPADCSVLMSAEGSIQR